MADELLPTGAAAAYLGVSGETLRRWADEEKVRHVRLPSGQLRFRPVDLDAILTPVEPKTAGDAA
jgi:excisionase family DNA binding protein